MGDRCRTEDEEAKAATAQRPASPPKSAPPVPAPSARALMLQRTAGNRAVSRLLEDERAARRLIARQDQSGGGPAASVAAPAPLSDLHQRFLSDLGIDPASLPPAVVPRLERALDRTRRAHEALRGNVSQDLGGSDVSATRTVTDTSAEVSVTVTDSEASITIRRFYDYGSRRLVQSFSYEDVDAHVLHATLETEGPNTLLADVPIVLRGEGGGGGGRIGPPPPPLGDEEIDTFEDAITPEPAGSEEGVGSFFVGAIAGDFAENDSFSAIAGQTVVGLIPIAGQVADVRDMASAIRGVAQGRDGAMLNVGIAAIGFIPGLDFLKGGSRVGRRALRSAAEESIDRAARTGLKQAMGRLSRAAAKQASGRLRELAIARIEMIERLRLVADSAAHDAAIRDGARKTMHAIRDHYKPSDLSGALRDLLGIPVKRYSSGTNIQHLGEVGTARRSMMGLRTQLRNKLAHGHRGSSTYNELSQLDEAVEEILRKTDEFLSLR